MAELAAAGVAPSESKLTIDPRMMVCVYPCYLDKSRSLEKGRKLPKEKCVEEPQVQLIAAAVSSIPLPYVVEGNKCHPKDFWQRGRVRVALNAVDSADPTTPNKPINDKFRSRKELLEYIASVIPAIKSKAEAERQTTKQDSSAAAKKNKAKKGRKK